MNNQLDFQSPAEAEEALAGLQPGTCVTTFHENEIAGWNQIRIGASRGAYLQATFVRSDGLVAITMCKP
ncbi:MAG: hypothetical protein AAGC74_06990 [Verrucomicrobiota bacterium]